MTDPSRCPVALNVNFDSLNEACGFPHGYRDPSFFAGFDRIAKLADRHGARLTLFVIGRDLEHPEVFARVREWSQAGHEIGNHTWSHPLNLAALPAARIREEIVRCHDIVTACTGREPKGFIAPAWCTSHAVTSCLIDLRYRYDTSPFPSALLYGLVLSMLWASRRDGSRVRTVLGRRDWLSPFRDPPRPYHVGRDSRTLDAAEKDLLLVLPLPTLGRFRPAVWHTLGFVFGWDRVFGWLRRQLREIEAFYYLMHPADVLGPDDLDPRFPHTLARMQVPLAEKLRRAGEALTIIAGSGRRMTTMSALADHVAAGSARRS